MARAKTKSKKPSKTKPGSGGVKGAAGRKARRAAKGVSKAVKSAKLAGKAATAARTATAARAAGGMAAGGIMGPAAVALSVIASQMKPGSALSNFLKKSKDKNLPRAMSPGPKKKRSKAKIDRETAPFKRKQKNIEANKQVRSIKESKAATREGQRGKVGPKRNVVKDKKGSAVRGDKSGKAIKFGKGTAAYKRMMEKRGNR